MSGDIGSIKASIQAGLEQEERLVGVLTVTLFEADAARGATQAAVDDFRIANQLDRSAEDTPGGGLVDAAIDAAEPPNPAAAEAARRRAEGHERLQHAKNSAERLVVEFVGGLALASGVKGHFPDAIDDKSTGTRLIQDASEQQSRLHETLSISHKASGIVEKIAAQPQPGDDDVDELEQAVGLFSQCGDAAQDGIERGRSIGVIGEDHLAKQ